MSRTEHGFELKLSRSNDPLTVEYTAAIEVGTPRERQIVRVMTGRTEVWLHVTPTGFVRVHQQPRKKKR